MKITLSKYTPLLFCLVWAVSFAPLYSYSPYSGNNISYGFDKVLNTYIFRFSGDYSLKNDFGELFLKQNYTGTSLTTISNYFRDDEAFSLLYKYPINNSIKATFNSNYNLNSDSKSSGINELQRINGSLGMEYNLFDKAILKFGYGLEDNLQAAVRSSGQLATFEARLFPIELEGYNFTSNSNLELLNLNKDRQLLDFSAAALMVKEYDQDNNLAFSVNYKKQSRDYVQPFIQEAIESRVEDRVSAFLDLNFRMNDNISALVNLNFENFDINREYKSPIADNNFSHFVRNMSGNSYGLIGETVFRGRFLSQIIGFNFSFRNENNSLSNKFDLDRDIYTRVLQQEKQRDNQSTLSRVVSRTLLNISPNDTLALNLSSAINRYDTPDKNNNDDRDEFTGNIGISYSRIFSEYLTARLNLDFVAIHLVFLKSARSSMNNWNRLMRLSPSIEYNSKYLSFKPRFEILANYTVYDYETDAGSTRSFSFRQISVSDSIIVRISQVLSIENRIYSRYNERGILYWDSFSETPQQGNIELFANSLLYYYLNNNSRIGLGVRYYNLKQSNLKYSGIPSNLNRFAQKSIGPELNIFIQLRNNSNVIIKGWYDFRRINDKELSPLGNLILQTNILL